MLKIACICLAVAAATPLWSQVEPSGSGGNSGLGDTHMMTPPPVGGGNYSGSLGSEERSNYLAGGMVFTAAYIDNLLLGGSATPYSDETYSLLPTIGFDRKTPRQSESLAYSAGFTIYQHTSDLNSVAQAADTTYRFRMSPYLVLILRDTFRQNNNLYNQSNPFDAGGIPGTPGQSNGNVISPYENQLANSSSAGIQYQYGKNAMVGASGSYSFQNFSGAGGASGLSNGGAAGASGFFSRRIAGSHYVGLTYQFSKFISHPIDTYTVTNTLFAFYTHYFNRSFSISLLGGPEHYTFWSAGTPSQGAWTPAVQCSFGWQTNRANVTANFAHIVGGTGGLLGTYHSDLLGVSSRFAVSRKWNVGADVNYSRFDIVNPSASAAYGNGGNSIFGGVYAERQITERVSAQAGYGHFHQLYAGVPAASANPDSNRANVSISYQFSRPLGR